MGEDCLLAKVEREAACLPPGLEGLLTVLPQPGPAVDQKEGQVQTTVTKPCVRSDHWLKEGSQERWPRYLRELRWVCDTE